MEKESADRLQEIVELSLLYDFYGELLKENQKQIYEDYVLNNLSLGEIADNSGISRQGVYDIVKRCTKQLKTYEERLHLIDKFGKAKQCVLGIITAAGEIKESREAGRVKEIMDLAEELLRQL